MHAIILKNPGEPEVLTWSQVLDLIPAPEQLLVRVKAAGLNRVDLLQRRGKYPPPPGESPILGLEIAGEVAAMGKDITHYHVGDRVFGLVGSGGYAEYCVIDAKTAMLIPNELSYIEAAAIPEAFLTANEAIFTLGELKAGETILIHAGASGVGSAGIQLAKQAGAVVFTTVSSSEKMQKVAALQPTAIFNYKNQDFVTEIQTRTQHQGVNVILDFIGGSYLTRNMESLSAAGRLICVGLMGGATAEINLDVLLKKRLQIKGLIMRTRSLEDKRRMAEHFKTKWLPLIANRQIKPIIDSVFALKDASKAHAYMEKNIHVGKIVLEI